MTLLLCFSGQIGSGKSSASIAVAEALGWKRTGFGDYLRSERSRAKAVIRHRAKRFRI
jgi:cytidylate kinase